MNSDQHPRQEPGTSPNHSPFSGTLTFNILMALAVILVLLILGILVIRRIATSTIPPAQMAAMHKLETTTLSLPRDWHSPATLPPPDVLAFHENFQKQMTALRKKHQALLEGDASNPLGILADFRTTSITEEQRVPFAALMADLQPIIDETSAAVRLKGYTLETNFELVPISFLDVQNFAKLASIAAVEQAKSGECLQAMETALLPMRLAKRPEQSYILSHLIGIALTYIAAQTVNNISSMCDDPATQQHGINMLNALYADIVPGDPELWAYEEMVALRYAAAYGYPVSLSPRSHAGLIRQKAEELWSMRYYEWLIANFSAADTRVVTARQRMADYKAELARTNRLTRFTSPRFMSPKGRRMFSAVTGVDPVLYDHLLMSANVTETTTRASVAKAAVDFARLGMVQRLTAAEGMAGAAEANGATADTASTGSVLSAPDTATITAYLTPPPVDPFTSNTYPYSAAINRHYSPGPDLDDDKTAIKYDATNGATSNGDLWLTGRW